MESWVEVMCDAMHADRERVARGMQQRDCMGFREGKLRG